MTHLPEGTLFIFFSLASFIQQCNRLCRRRHSPCFVQLSFHDFFLMLFFVTIFFFFSKMCPLFYFSGSFHVSGHGFYPKILFSNQAIGPLRRSGPKSWKFRWSWQPLMVLTQKTNNNGNYVKEVLRRFFNFIFDFRGWILSQESVFCTGTNHRIKKQNRSRICIKIWEIKTIQSPLSSPDLVPIGFHFILKVKAALSDIDIDS